MIRWILWIYRVIVATICRVILFVVIPVLKVIDFIIVMIKWFEYVVSNFIQDRAENLKAICRPRNWYIAFKVILLWYLYTKLILDPWEGIIRAYHGYFGEWGWYDDNSYALFNERNQMYFEMWYLLATYYVVLRSHYNIHLLREDIRSKRKREKGRAWRLFCEGLYGIGLVLVTLFYIYCSLVLAGIIDPWF